MVSSVIYDMITTNMIVNELCAFAMVVFADGTKIHLKLWRIYHRLELFISPVQIDCLVDSG